MRWRFSGKVIVRIKVDGVEKGNLAKNMEQQVTSKGSKRALRRANRTGLLWKM